MKKLLTILAISLAFCVSAQTTIKWPAGAWTAVTTSSVTKTTTITPISIVNNNQYNIFTVDTSLVLRLTVNSSVKAGALLYIKVVAGATGATWAVTGSTGVTMASYNLTSAKTHLFSFIYDGTNYLNTGVIKIN